MCASFGPHSRWKPDAWEICWACLSLKARTFFVYVDRKMFIMCYLHGAFSTIKWHQHKKALSMCPPSTPHIKSHFHHPLISAKSFIFLTLGFMGYRKKKVINIILCDFRPRKRGDPEVGWDDKQRTNVFESTLLRKANDNLKLYRIILPHTYYPKMMETQAPGKR
jgi:hypothetical protein